MNAVNKKNRPIIIVDGMNNFIRHFLVNEAISTKSEPIGGIVGFLRFLKYLMNTFSPGKVFVVWESGGASAKRKAIFKDYKKNRGKIKEFKKLKNGTATMRDTLMRDDKCKIKQLSELYKLLKNTPICQVFLSGTECDDIVAHLAVQHFRTNTGDKIVVSNDKDFYQLLEDKSVLIYNQANRAMVTGDKVFEKFGIAPRNFCLARAIVGDPSDNIPGVPGVGLKTAVKRFPELADRTRDVTITGIIKSCEEKLSGKSKLKVYKEVLNSEEIIRRNWKLMYLSSGVLSAKEIAKVEFALESHEPKMNKINLIKEVMSSGIGLAFDVDDFTGQMRSLLT